MWDMPVCMHANTLLAPNGCRLLARMPMVVPLALPLSIRPQVRSTGHSVASAVARIGAMLAPQVRSYVPTNKSPRA